MKKSYTRFLDANVFIYAYYKLKPGLTEEQRKQRTSSRGLAKGERVVTTVVHLSEVSNILKRALPSLDLQQFLIGLFSLDNVPIVGVSREVAWLLPNSLANSIWIPTTV